MHTMSNTTDPMPILQAAKSGSSRLSYGKETYAAVRNKLEMFPYQVTYLYASKYLNPPIFKVIVFFIAITAAVLVLSFGISFVRSRKIFLPFHKFSMAVRRQSFSDDLNLKSIPADLFKSGSRNSP